jgi:hypothetical protein
VAIIQPPQLAPVRLDQKIDAGAVGELVLLSRGLALAIAVAKSFQMVSARPSGASDTIRDTIFVSDWCRIGPDLARR